MGNIVGIQRADLIIFQSRQRHRMPVIADKLDFKCGAIPVNQHDGSHIPSNQAMCGQLTSQRHDIQFINRFHILGRG